MSTLNTATFALTNEHGETLQLRALDTGRTWNGFPVPLLSQLQAQIIGLFIGEDMNAGPADGLTWARIDDTI